MTEDKKKAIYESIMKDVAKVVKKKVNESNIDFSLDASYKVAEELGYCIGAIESANDLSDVQDALISAIKALYQGLVLVSQGERFRPDSLENN